MAPLAFVIAVIALGALPATGSIVLPPAPAAVIVGGALLAAAAFGLRASAPIVVATYGVSVGIALSCGIDPRGLPLETLALALWPSLVAPAVMAALAGALALAHWRLGDVVWLETRTRAVLVAIVIVASATVVACFDDADVRVTCLLTVAAFVLVWMTTAPLDDEHVAARAIFFSLGVAALVCATFFVVLSNDFFSASFSVRSPLRLASHVVMCTDALAHHLRAAAVVLASFGPLAFVVAARLGPRGSVVVAAPVVVFGLTLAIAYAATNRYAEAALGHYVAALADDTLDVVRRDETASWSELEVPPQPAIVVRHGVPIAPEDRAAVQRATAVAQQGMRLPPISVLGERATTLGEILAAIDPAGRQPWDIAIVYEARSPIASDNPLAAAFPRLRAEVFVAHRMTASDALVIRHIRRARSREGEAFVFADDATVAEIVARGTSDREAFLRTAH